MKDPTVFSQMPSEHGTPSLHSLISWHVWLSNWNPSWQTQVQDPILLMHSPEPQGSIRHSSISAWKKLKIVFSMARWIRLGFNYHRSRWRSLRSQRGIDNDRIRVNWGRSQLRRKFANEFQRIHQYPDMLSNLRPKRSLQDKCTCNCWERWHRCASIRHCRRRTRQYLKMNFKWTDSSQYV